MKNTYIIDISREKVNKNFSKPTIVKFADSVNVCGYLNFPSNWLNWRLPKNLYKKDLKIISFNTGEIVVGW